MEIPKRRSSTALHDARAKSEQGFANSARSWSAALLRRFKVQLGYTSA